MTWTVIRADGGAAESEFTASTVGPAGELLLGRDWPGVGPLTLEIWAPGTWRQAVWVEAARATGLGEPEIPHVYVTEDEPTPVTEREVASVVIPADYKHEWCTPPRMGVKYKPGELRGVSGKTAVFKHADEYGDWWGWEIGE